MSKKGSEDVVNPLPIAVNDFYKSNGVNVVLSDWSPSLTRQEFAEECDINAIMKRYEVTGQLPVTSTAPQYLDLTSVPDNLIEVMQLFEHAEDSFMRLPASVRREFENDAHQFVVFASDPENLPQMRTWGLAPPVEPPGGLVVSPPGEHKPAPPPAPAAPPKAPEGA